MLINYEIIEKVNKVNKIINPPDDVPDFITAKESINKNKEKKDEINKNKK